MPSKNVLALDTNADRIVHIEQVPESYKYCICPKCGQNLIAANKRSDTRKVAYYFRHQSNSGCGLETALHRYAKELVCFRKSSYLPEYEKTVTQEDKSGKPHEATFKASGALCSYSEVRPEERLVLAEKTIRPDLTCTTADDEVIYIEIKVTHRTGQRKRTALRNSHKSAFEIDLGELLKKDYIGLEELDSFILETAPRHWLTTARYSEKIEQRKADLARHVARTNRNIDREAQQARERAERRRRKEQEERMEWREKFSVLAGQLNEYASRDHRNLLIGQYKQRFDRTDTYEYLLRQRYKKEFGGIPHLVNIPVKGELAFTCHRIVWQSEIMNRLVLPEYEEAIQKAEIRKAKRSQLYKVSARDNPISILDLPHFRPLSIYESLLNNGVAVSELVLLSEAAAQEPIEYEDNGRRPKLMRYMEPAQYELLPKPVCAIRQYLRILCDLKIFVSDENLFRAISPTPPNLGIKLPDYDHYISEGLKQYSS